MTKPLDDLAEKETKEYLQRRNKLMLEAVMGCCLDSMSVQETAKLLREMADQLEEYT